MLLFKWRAPFGRDLAVSIQIVGGELARDSEVGIARERASYTGT
jgi:hypothetical protein